MKILIRAKHKENGGYKTWIYNITSLKKAKPSLYKFLKYINEPVEVFTFDGYSEGTYGTLIDVKEVNIYG